MSTKSRTLSLQIKSCTMESNVTVHAIRPLTVTRRLYSACFLAVFLFLNLFPLFLGNQPADYDPTSTCKVKLISMDEPVLNLTFYSHWNDTKTPIMSGDRIAGDHIILNATFTPNSDINRTRLEVNATAIPILIVSDVNHTSVEIDTRRLGNNATCTINVTAWLTTGVEISRNVTNVFIGNFFVPKIEVVSPNGGENITKPWNVTWTAYDNNTEEVLEFEVRLSSDGGSTFQLLTTGLTETRYEWNSSGFLLLSSYVIEVRVTDGIYTTSDQSDGPFTAGDVVPTTTTPPPTTTSTTTASPTTPAPVDYTMAGFVSASIIGSAFLALAVYYVAKTRIYD
ncbi:MAG: hypothetical protein JSW61_05625 [Candidatus Thorarchaeota archaeon]|nr:MAG: hypothetical protein JSW61_05625 [Candidatus Thorarchaeota archaeon]